MKTKILFIIWSYTYGGGAEALLTMIANNLNPQKYDVSIIEYMHADIKTEKVNDNIHVLPPIEKVDTPEKTSKGYQVYHTPELLIDKYIRGDYDIYISFNYQIPTFLLPKGAKNIAWIHGDVYDLGVPEAQREWCLQDEAFDKVRKIVAISDFTMQSLKDLFPRHRDKIVKIYNGVDVKKVRKDSLDMPTVILQHPAIVYSGRLDVNKNPERMLDVFLLLHEKDRNVHLYYLGKGELEDKIRERAEQFKIQDNVHLLGYYENPFPVIRQADIVCLFSKSEGFGLCLAEAIALGKPIVASDIGIAKTISLDGKCGKVIYTDEEAADAILYYINADKSEIERNCNKSIAQFEINNYIKQIETLIDEVIVS